MRQNIDPGEGYRLLTPDDVRRLGDEYDLTGDTKSWAPIGKFDYGKPYSQSSEKSSAYRRKITNDWPVPPAPIHNPITKPKHYTTHPSGVECIQVTEHMNFCRGNAMKYLWRAGEKDDVIQDLKKAVWYIQREIERIEKDKK